jgi:hypothetical protein
MTRDVSNLQEFTEAAARASGCWFDVDHVSRDPATTSWKRCARWRQAQWRESRGYPIGTSPYRGGEKAKLVGSRLELQFARESGANFLTEAAEAAVRNRLANPELHQMLNEDRLFADLLSSMPLCFNVFGELAGDREAAKRAVRTWWPDAPAGDIEVKFEHSPGRRDPAFLGNQSAFDVAFEIGSGESGRGIIGVETKYHEHAVVEPEPKPAAFRRYVEVTERSGIFVDGWRDKIVGTRLQQVWLDHLLVLAMLQHPSKRWASGRFVLVFPKDNPSFTAVSKEYAGVLRDPRTFEVRTLESFVATDALAATTVDAIRARYLNAT